MSELINNRQKRQELLKGIIQDLHAGVNLEEIKSRFEDLLGAVVSPTEISEMEQALIDEGMPAEEIQKLCDVHVAVFREALDKQLEDAVRLAKEHSPAGHPVDVFKKENQAIIKVLDQIDLLVDNISGASEGEDIHGEIRDWQEHHKNILQIDNHYLRKENIIFPFLEKYGISGPPSVMWGIHDEIREQLKEINKLFVQENYEANRRLIKKINELVQPSYNAIREMIYKEENILFPMCMETFTSEEWDDMANQSHEIGFTLIEPPTVDEQIISPSKDADEVQTPEGSLQFATGSLSPEEISKILNSLPMDITFVDKNDRVKFFSHGEDRIFSRTPAVIGRKVQNCHPPASVHIVNQIVDDFKTRKRDKAEFWLNVKGMFVYIQYIPLFSDHQEYLGTLEMSQNITHLRDLQGEKRIDTPENN